MMLLIDFLHSTTTEKWKSKVFNLISQNHNFIYWMTPGIYWKNDDITFIKQILIATANEDLKVMQNYFWESLDNVKDKLANNKNE